MMQVSSWTRVASSFSSVTSGPMLKSGFRPAHHHPPGAPDREDGGAFEMEDEQASFGNTVMKGNACKVRRMRGDQILAGFAGGTAGAFTLFERFEAKRDRVELTGLRPSDRPGRICRCYSANCTV